MQLKKISLIFSLTVLLLMLLMGFKSGFFLKYKPAVTKIITHYLQNNSTNQKNAQKSLIKIENLLIDRLVSLETPRSEITIMHLLEDSTIEIKAPLLKGKPTEWIIWYLCSAAKTAGYLTEDCYYQEDPFKCTITLQSDKKGQPTVKIDFTQSNKYFSSTAKMAIVISEFGFQANVTTVDYLAFPEPVTISLVSSKKMAVTTAQLAFDHNKEIILLLPMEPLSRPYATYKNEAIFLHYTPERIHSIINKNTVMIPFYSGFSNLCGTRVLDDSRVMRIVLEEIKNKNSYFLIDHASSRSVAVALARELKVPYRTVEISLDSSESGLESLSDTLKHAAIIAQKTGSVVVAGRATPQFIKAIKEQLPHFQHNGIQLVPVSDLVHHP
jgi:uncharacterized protein